jgi:hypothetical protein
MWRGMRPCIIISYKLISISIYIPIPTPILIIYDLMGVDAYIEV